jgi:hypothetical protein
MRWLTEDARLVCDHRGRVSVKATQDLVRIEKRRVLVRPNPEGRSIRGCPNTNPFTGYKSCTGTQEVREGYSTFVRIMSDEVCLDSLLGYTNGDPPRVVNYKVADPAQEFVEASE